MAFRAINIIFSVISNCYFSKDYIHPFLLFTVSFLSTSLISSQYFTHSFSFDILNTALLPFSLPTLISIFFIRTEKEGLFDQNERFNYYTLLIIGEVYCWRTFTNNHAQFKTTTLPNHPYIRLNPLLNASTCAFLRIAEKILRSSLPIISPHKLPYPSLFQKNRSSCKSKASIGFPFLNCGTFHAHFIPHSFRKKLIIQNIKS